MRLAGELGVRNRSMDAPGTDLRVGDLRTWSLIETPGDRFADVIPEEATQRVRTRLCEEADEALMRLTELMESAGTSADPNGRAEFQSSARFVVTKQLVPAVLAVACSIFSAEDGWAESIAQLRTDLELASDGLLFSDAEFLEQASRVVDQTHGRACTARLPVEELRSFTLRTFDGTLAEFVEAYRAVERQR